MLIFLTSGKEPLYVIMYLDCYSMSFCNRSSLLKMVQWHNTYQSKCSHHLLCSTPSFLISRGLIVTWAWKINKNLYNLYLIELCYLIVSLFFHIINPTRSYMMRKNLLKKLFTSKTIGLHVHCVVYSKHFNTERHGTAVIFGGPWKCVE